MKLFVRMVGLLCLWGVLVARTYRFENKSLFLVEVVAIIAWLSSEIDWHRKIKQNLNKSTLPL